MSLRILLVLLLSVQSVSVLAGTVEHTGKVSKIMFFSDGWGNYNEDDNALMTFYMEPALPNACTDGEARVAIGVKHPLYQSIVSTLLAAKMSESSIKIKYIDKCNVRGNSWDFGYLLIE